MTTSNQQPKFFAIILICLLFAFTPLLAFGVTLDQAKQQGLLGERPDGYLGLAKPSASPETVNLMKDINRKRRDVYKGIAEKKRHSPFGRRSPSREKGHRKNPIRTTHHATQRNLDPQTLIFKSQSIKKRLLNS